jgi:hypothetical protein
MQRSSKSRNFPKRSPVKRQSRLSSEASLKVLTPQLSINADTTGAIALANGIVPGFDIAGRLGRLVTIKSILVDIEDFATAATGIDQYHRTLLVYDRQTNGAALAVTDVLSSVNVLAPYNFGNLARFVILYDQAHYLNAVSEPGSGLHYRIRVRRPLDVVFNAGTAGTVADIQSGSLYLIAIGNVAAGVAAGAIVSQFTIKFHSHV